MTYPNAQAGLAKYFKGEILNLISVACLIVASILTFTILGTFVIGDAGVTVAGGVGVLFIIILTIASFVLAIVGYIIGLVGLKQAGKDHERFAIAFAVQIFVLIITAVGFALTIANAGNGIADNITNSFSRVADVFMVVFVITGTLDLVHKVGAADTFNKGYTTMNVIVVMYALSAVAIIIPVFFPATVAVGLIELILVLVSGVLSIVGYIMFLVFLGKAKNALKEEKKEA